MVVVVVGVAVMMLLLALELKSHGKYKVGGDDVKEKFDDVMGVVLELVPMI